MRPFVRSDDQTGGFCLRRPVVWEHDNVGIYYTDGQSAQPFSLEPVDIADSGLAFALGSSYCLVLSSPFVGILYGERENPIPKPKYEMNATAYSTLIYVNTMLPGCIWRINCYFLISLMNM
jgi:hypothetical protein